jgi:heme exporter protein B
MFRQAIVICGKDIRSEVRTRYALNALVMFVIVVVSVIKFSLGEERLSSDLLAGLLWIIIFFSNSSGLARTFVSEEERETSLFLKLVLKPAPILLGKLIFNISLSSVINIINVFLFIIVTGFSINSPVLFAVTIFLGNLGMAAVMTIIASLISKANTKGTLYPVLSFPLLLPLLVSVIDATKLCAEGTVLGEVSGDFQIIISYTVVVITASFLVFDLVWND